RGQCAHAGVKPPGGNWGWRRLGWGLRAFEVNEVVGFARIMGADRSFSRTASQGSRRGEPHTLADSDARAGAGGNWRNAAITESLVGERVDSVWAASGAVRLWGGHADQLADAGVGDQGHRPYSDQPHPWRPRHRPAWVVADAGELGSHG